jgi:hypothetical protein
MTKRFRRYLAILRNQQSSLHFRNSSASKLEAAKDPVEVLVIDSVSKPSEN